MDFIRDETLHHDEPKTNNIHSYMNDLQQLSADKITPWAGLHIFADMFYLYLYRKYKKNCLPVSNDGAELVLCANVDDEKCIYFHDRIEESISNICRCIESGIDILLIPVRIYMKSSNTTHANLLVYRKNNMSIEIFEPHGQYIDDFQREGINIAYKTLLADIELNLPNTMQLQRISQEQVCPIFGLQEAEEQSLKKRNDNGGYCLAWSMFFAELVLMNPKYTSQELMHEIFKILKPKKENAHDYLLDVIIGYINSIESIMTGDISILADNKLSFDDFIKLICKPQKTNEEQIIFNNVMSNHKQWFQHTCKINSHTIDTIAQTGGSSKKKKKSSSNKKRTKNSNKRTNNSNKRTKKRTKKKKTLRLFNTAN
jgi:hypothetical protein